MMIMNRIGKALTWDELEDLYSGTSRTKSIKEIFAWAKKQPSKFFIDSEHKTIHLKQGGIMKTVGVKYATTPGITYTFMTEFDCKVGDKAVVFTSGNWSVVTIVEIHDKLHLDDSYQYTWLVQIVDRTEYDRLIIQDGEGYPSAGNRL